VLISGKYNESLFSAEANLIRAADDNDVNDGGAPMTGEGVRPALTAAEKKKAKAAQRRARRTGNYQCTFLI